MVSAQNLDFLRGPRLFWPLKWHERERKNECKKYYFRELRDWRKAFLRRRVREKTAQTGDIFKLAKLGRRSHGRDREEVLGIWCKVDGNWEILREK